MEVEKLFAAVGKAVIVNEVKPRKGAFVIRIGDDCVVELLALPRPFTKLRELDLSAALKPHLK